MTFQQLVYFKEIHNAGSTQKAAENLCVSQSTISAALKNLEAEIGCVLFDRTSKGLQINNAGMELYIRAEDILSRMDMTMQEMKKFVARKEKVTIGLPPLMQVVLWPDLYLMLAERFPEVTFELVSETTGVLLEMVREKNVDLILIPAQVNEISSLTFDFCLYRKAQPKTIALSRRNPLAQYPVLELQQILDLPLIGYVGDDRKQQCIKDIYGSMGRKPNFVFRCSQISTLLSFLRKDVGIAWLYPGVAGQDPNIATVRFAEEKLPLPPPRRDEYVVWNRFVLSKLITSQIPHAIQRMYAER